MAKSNIFNSIQLPKVGSSNFDLSHDVKLSLDMGLLVPTLCQEVLPGDRWSVSCETMLRFAPLVAPVMHRFRVFQHYFFVPNRLVWPSFYDWLFDKETVAFPTLQLEPENAANGTLADYLGVPEAWPISQTINAIPFAGYQMIYDEFYRDQNLIEEVGSELISGINNNDKLVTLRRRAWKHDYFTSALPFAQRGSDVLIPIGSFTDVNVYRDSGGSGDGFYTAASGTPANGAPTFPGLQANMDDANSEEIHWSPGTTLKAETSGLEAEAQSIRDLRRAFKLQEWLERNARSGVRAKEGLLAHFGVRVQDERLDRPEFIYGTSNSVVVSEVLQTAEGTDPVGNMAGHGISVGSSGRKSYYAPEHGYIYCIMSVMPEPAYQQGLPRHFWKGAHMDRFSYAWPTFQHIGEQEVLNLEIYNAGTDLRETFGYAPRYSEYKYIPSSVHGDFRDTLNHWHDGRIFSNQPVLNQEFVECVPDKRIFAVQDGNSLWAQVYHNLRVRRKLAYYANPGF